MLQRIMLVEDEPDIRALCELVLDMDEQFDVRAYADSYTACADFEAVAPQLVLLDVMMPGEDGPAMLRRLREAGELAETSVIFLTARAQPGDVQRYIEMGAIGVIEKPFDPLRLSTQIRRIWGDYHG